MKNASIIFFFMVFIFSCSGEQRIKEGLILETRVQDELHIEESYMLGDGFSLSFGDTSIEILYNGEKVKEFLYDLDTNPFVWDEGCNKLTNIITSLPIDAMDKRNKAWSLLGLEEKKKCIEQNYKETFIIGKISQELFSIEKKWYEKKDLYLFDSTRKKVIDGYFGDWIKKVQSFSGGTLIYYEGGRGGVGGINNLTSEDTVIQIFENNCELQDISPKECQQITDFEFLGGTKVDIFYENGLGEKNKKQIDLDDYK